jgi:26S proteasome subunit RPN7
LGFGSSASGSGAKKIDLHQAVEAKLALCTALSHLANGNYAKATHDFLQPMNAAALAPWNGAIISVGDIAVYATLCALATLGRSELKARVVESEGLAGEGEGMKELLDAWMASNFRAVLGLLEKFSVSAQFRRRRGALVNFFFFHFRLTILLWDRLVICSIPYLAHTLRISRRSSALAQSCSISSRSRRSGLSA